jgi:hypothetical protein
MGAADTTDDPLGEFMPSRDGLEVHTVPLPDPPDPPDPRDPRALLAALVERMHGITYEQSKTASTLETIRATVGRLANAGNMLSGNDSTLANEIVSLKREIKELREHVQALEKWQAELTGKATVYASLGGALMLVLTWAMEHLRLT